MILFLFPSNRTFDSASVSSFLCSLMATNNAAASSRCWRKKGMTIIIDFLFMGMHHGGDNDLDNNDERSNNAIFSGVSARLIALHPLQYWMSAENYFQFLHTKMCVKGADAKRRCARYSIASTLMLRWQTHRIQNKFRHTSNTFNFFSFGTMCCICAHAKNQSEFNFPTVQSDFPPMSSSILCPCTLHPGLLPWGNSDEDLDSELWRLLGVAEVMQTAM